MTSNNERSGRIKRLRAFIEETLKSMWVYMIKMIKMIKQALFNKEGLSLKLNDVNMSSKAISGGVHMIK